jgi:hypothetical protein
MTIKVKTQLEERVFPKGQMQVNVYLKGKTDITRFLQYKQREKLRRDTDALYKLAMERLEQIEQVA